ncbi:APH(3') family aminoglycoside O-phosphotransferase [Longispora fulva]|uniref:APH(3') family aminoglycoside O-phosphotransferase n=1 Tax=Longispora fulva TaxID=619741 RepID=UPI0018C9203F|nr:APH(3') family aminoglycoside O-phosphotransferase [Longispora fulva]
MSRQRGGRRRERWAQVTWHPVEIGRSGAVVEWREGMFRKTSDDPRMDLEAEGARLRWLRDAGIPTAEVLDCGPGYLITAEVPGRSAADPWPVELRPRVIDALADLLIALHALPVEDCPYDRSLHVTLPEALRAEPDLDDLDEARRGWTRDQLVEELGRTQPASEDLVVTHGDLCMPNVLFAPDTCRVTGVIDAGRMGVADRWVDLAIATRSMTSRLNAQYGPWAAERFLTRYGTEPDPGKTAFYRLLDEFA